MIPYSKEKLEELALEKLKKEKPKLIAYDWQFDGILDWDENNLEIQLYTEDPRDGHAIFEYIPLNKSELNDTMVK